MELAHRTVTVPELGLIAGTRVALGVGIGLLLSSRLSRDQRLGAGWALVAFGALTTFPLAAEVLLRHEPTPPRGEIEEESEYATAR
jgi:hypothetical protein